MRTYYTIRANGLIEFNPHRTEYEFINAMHPESEIGKKIPGLIQKMSESQWNDFKKITDFFRGKRPLTWSGIITYINDLPEGEEKKQLRKQYDI